MFSNHFFLISIVALPVILKFLADFLAHTLGQDRENRVRAELEHWRNVAKQDSSDTVFLPLFQAPARLLTRILGPRLLSWRALKAMVVITSLLLVICFCLEGIFNGFNPPGKEFAQSLDVLQKRPPTRQNSSLQITSNTSVMPPT